MRFPLFALTACSLVAACDPMTYRDAGQTARPTLERTTEAAQAARPTLVEAGLGLCDPNAFTCSDSDTLEHCSTRGLTESSCSSVCASAGYSTSLGCGYEPSLGGDACFCDDVQSTPAPSCLPGWACSGDLALSYCSASTIETWNCDSVCRNAGFAAALACDYDDRGEATCFCDDAPACAPGDQACGDGTCVQSAYICDGYDDCPSGADEAGCALCLFESRCNGSHHVDTCDGAGVLTWSCDEICQQSGFDYSEGCAYDRASGLDSCFCNTAPTCYADELACGDGSCLPNQYVCDGYVDCAGGTDEVGCVAECIPGEVFCTGPYTIETCDDFGYWVDWSCDEVCQQSGFREADSCSYDSFGGTDACFCR
jgi:integrin beta 2